MKNNENEIDDNQEKNENENQNNEEKLKQILKCNLVKQED